MPNVTEYFITIINCIDYNGKAESLELFHYNIRTLVIKSEVDIPL